MVLIIKTLKKELLALKTNYKNYYEHLSCNPVIKISYS